MKILATAGRLLLTQKFVQLALDEGHEVVLLTRPQSALKESDIVSDAEFLTVFDIDLLDTENLKQVLLLFKPDMIFHFDLHLFESPDLSPDDYWSRNEEGTRSLLWAMTQAGSHSLIMASSSTVYGPLQEAYLSEKHIPQPTTDCGESLLSGEEMALEFQRSVPHARLGILRIFEALASPSTFFEVEGLLSHYLQLLQKNLPWEIAQNDLPTRDGTAVRDFVDVDDLASVFLEGAIKLKRESHFISNVGNGLGITIAELWEICTQMKDQKIQLRVNPLIPYEHPRTVADIRFFKSWYPHPLKNIRQILAEQF